MRRHATRSTAGDGDVVNVGKADAGVGDKILTHVGLLLATMRRIEPERRSAGYPATVRKELKSRISISHRESAALLLVLSAAPEVGRRHAVQSTCVLSNV